MCNTIKSTERGLQIALLFIFQLDDGLQLEVKRAKLSRLHYTKLQAPQTIHRVFKEHQTTKSMQSYIKLTRLNEWIAPLLKVTWITNTRSLTEWKSFFIVQEKLVI